MEPLSVFEQAEPRKVVVGRLGGAVVDDETVEKRERIPFSSKMRWLNGLLWGGSGLLAFEHLWHGEVTPFFPFLTAMKNKDDMMEMFKEMATVGVCMALLITFVWIVVCVVADSLMKKDNSSVNA